MLVAKYAAKRALNMRLRVVIILQLNIAYTVVNIYV